LFTFFAFIIIQKLSEKLSKNYPTTTPKLSKNHPKTIHESYPKTIQKISHKYPKNIQKLSEYKCVRRIIQGLPFFQFLRIKIFQSLRKANFNSFEILEALLKYINL